MTTIIDLLSGLLSVISQNFSQGKLLKAKVTFTISVGDVSSISMGILSIWFITFVIINLKLL